MSYTSSLKFGYKSKVYIPLIGNGEAGSSVIINGLNSGSIKWQISDTDYLEPASTNIVLHSNDFSQTQWVLTAGVSGGSGTKTTMGTVLGPDGVTPVTLWKGRDVLYAQNVGTLPAGTYTLSFLYWGNANQPANTRTPNGGTDKLGICFKPYWQRFTVTFTLASSATNCSVRIDFRNSQLGGANTFCRKTDDNFAFAMTQVQLEAQNRATSFMPSGASQASRSANQVATGWAFQVPSGSSGSKITAVDVNTDRKGDRTFDKKRYAVFLGQSQFIFGSTNDPYILKVHPMVKCIGRRENDASYVSENGNITWYSDPSHWGCSYINATNDNDDMGPDDGSLAGQIMSMISRHLGGVEVIGELANVPGSSWSVTWNSGGSGTNYNTLISRLNAFKSTYPTAECVGIFCNPQETDVNGNVAFATHKTNVTNTINSIKAVTGDVPVMFIGTQDDWVSTYPALKASYMVGYRDLNNGTNWSGLTKARFIDTEASQNGGVNYESNADTGSVTGDTTHFNIQSHLKIADKMYEYWKVLYGS